MEMVTKRYERHITFFFTCSPTNIPTIRSTGPKMVVPTIALRWWREIRRVKLDRRVGTECCGTMLGPKRHGEERCNMVKS